MALAAPTLTARPDPLAVTGVSLVIPAYNEVGGIEGTVRQVCAILEASGFEHEVIVVDDGSDDGTAELLDGLELPGLTVLRHAANRGYGASLKTGIRAARHDVVAITDADGTYPNERLPELIAQIGRYDMVVGARIGDNVHIPTLRKPAKRVLNQLANYLSETRIPDLNSGLRVMRKPVVERFLKILPDAFSFTTTITLAMLSDGYGVRYLPIDYHPRKGRSKIHPIKDTVRFTQLVIRTVMYFNPLRVFVPLSLGLLLASLAGLAYRMIVGEGLLVLSTILFVSAIQVLTTGMIADLVVKTSSLRRRDAHA